MQPAPAAKVTSPRPARKPSGSWNTPTLDCREKDDGSKPSTGNPSHDEHAGHNSHRPDDTAALAPMPLCREALREELQAFADTTLRAVLTAEMCKLTEPKEMNKLPSETDRNLGSQPSGYSLGVGPEASLAGPEASLVVVQPPGSVALPPEAVQAQRRQSRCSTALDSDNLQSMSIVPSPPSPSALLGSSRSNIRNELEALRVMSQNPKKSRLERFFEHASHRYTKVADWVDKQADFPICERFEGSATFGIISAVLIVANSYVMALTADYQMAHLESPHNTTHDFLEIIFVSAYTVELLIRLVSKRMRFFCSGWGWFDLVIVVGGCLEVAKTSNDRNSNVTQFRVMRVLKMLKVMRVVRLMRALREVRLLLDSLMGSLRPLMWTIFLIAAIIFMFGVLFVNAVAVFLAEEADAGISIDPADYDALIVAWGSVPEAMYTLFSCANGGEDWREAATLLQLVGWHNFTIFMLYIVIFVFVVTNSVCAIFVEAAAEYEKRDQSRLMQEQLAMKKDYVAMVVAIYDEMDTDKTGYVSKAEFIARMEDPRMLAFASALEIDAMDLEQFFDVMSLHGTKRVDLEGFVEGCIRLRGNARSMDVIEILVMQKRLYHEVGRIRAFMNLDYEQYAREQGLDAEGPPPERRANVKPATELPHVPTQAGEDAHAFGKWMT